MLKATILGVLKRCGYTVLRVSFLEEERRQHALRARMLDQNKAEHETLQNEILRLETEHSQAGANLLQQVEAFERLSASQTNLTAELKYEREAKVTAESARELTAARLNESNVELVAQRNAKNAARVELQQAKIETEAARIET
ncbi:MAG: hypothetical protein ACKVIF_11425, partial [Rhodospirillales bacterium]